MIPPGLPAATERAWLGLSLAPAQHWGPKDVSGGDQEWTARRTLYSSLRWKNEIDERWLSEVLNRESLVKPGCPATTTTPTSEKGGAQDSRALSS